VTSIFDLDEAGSTLSLTYAIIAIISGITFAPVKSFFDKITARVFYKNAYSPEKFIDSFSDKVVKNYQIDELINSSMEVLQQYLQPEHVAFVIRRENGQKFIVRTNAKRVPEEEQLRELSDALQQHNQAIVSVDEIAESLPAEAHLLRRYGVNLLVRLIVSNERVGYLALGEKKNGEQYGTRDRLVLGVISEELALAVQNALRYQEIEGFNEKLISEIDKATRELRRSNDKLKALDEAKDEFISMASHQLRTPLTSIKGYISMVLEGDAGEINDDQKQMLNQAFLSSQRMVYLIADLLNVSRLRTGKFVIEPVETWLPDVVEGEIKQLYESAKARGLTIHFNKPEHFPTVMLDETKIRQVIMNFADNALYYTPLGGTIPIELKEDKNTIQYIVTDTGIGVPRSMQHKLFTKFYRAENAQRARPDGTGLGLFMAKKVIVASGGAIIFKSKEGKGSTFGFSFPKDKIIKK